MIAVLMAPTFCVGVALAQNLVPNPGFETQTSCPLVSEIEKAPPWNSPTVGTPDLFNTTCPQQNGAGRTGIGSAGFFAVSTFPDNREYIQAPLLSPLVAGQGYCVSFWVLRSNFQLASDRFGAYFSTAEVSQNVTSVLNFTPQVERAPGSVVTGSAWTEISGQFMAAGGETHILIGSFANDAATTTQLVNPGSTSAVAYYRIDDISVIPCNVGIEEKLDASRIDVFPQPAEGALTVRFPAAWDLVSAEIIALDGRIVRGGDPVAQRTGLLEMDVFGLPAGMYVLNLRTARSSVARRIVVQ
jgi:hypothetical protein